MKSKYLLEWKQALGWLVENLKAQDQRQGQLPKPRPKGQGQGLALQGQGLALQGQGQGYGYLASRILEAKGHHGLGLEDYISGAAE